MKILLVLLIPFFIINAYAETFIVEIQPGSSEPDTENWYGGNEYLIIIPGDTVIWQNNDLTVHTITSMDANGNVDRIVDSGPFDTDTAFEITFPSPMIFYYFCNIHPWMTGAVEVEDVSDDEIIKRLRGEVDFYKTENDELKGKINQLETMISRLNDRIDNLVLLTMEQMRVIYNWVEGNIVSNSTMNK